MRILMYSAGMPFTAPQTGGNKRFAELARYLAHNCNADICCADADRELGDLKPFVKYRFDSGKASRMKFLPPEARKMLANRRTLKRIRRENYDYVIAFDVPPTMGLCLFGIKNIVLMIRKDLIGYDEVVHPGNTLKNRCGRAFLKACEALCTKRAKKIIVQCDYDKAQLLKRQPKLDAGKISVQINNVNPSWIVEKSVRGASEEKGKNGFRIGFIGNFRDRRKGHDLLLEVAQRIVSENQGVIFEIIGGGGDWEAYRRAYESEQIRFYGMVPNPIAIIMQCDLAVVPSMADSCPNTLMEALYNGIPVVGSNRGGIPEILDNDKNALFDLDFSSLYEILSRYIHDAEALEALSLAEKRRREELTFDWAERMSRLITDE